MLLNLQTAHSGHLHVNHGAIRIRRASQDRKKLLAGGENPDLHAPGVQQAVQRPAHGGVIVDDMDEWGGIGQLILPSRLVSVQPV
jgi:hypothetical protein